jgi:glycosyltransferase involved in cell wall biosynthesis
MAENLMERKLNVLTVIKHPVGGIRTYLKYTYARLDKKEYRFTVLTAHDDYETTSMREGLKGVDPEMVEVDEKYFTLKMIINLMKLLYGNKIDVIHSQGFTAGMLTSIANVFFKKPHVITTHGVLIEGLFSSRFGFLKKYVYDFLLTRADVIQSVSHDAQDSLIKYLPSLSRKKEKLVVILNGIPVEKFSGEPEGSGRSLREELGIKNDVFLFGYLGRFMPEKGFPYLIDAVEALSKSGRLSGKFKIVAVNDGSFVREYKAIIQEKRISDYFIFYGFTSNVGRIIKGLDAVVIPSLYESSSLVAMEAFVLGCPVIASKCIGLREVVADSPALYIEKIADADAIAGALTRFLSDPERIKKDTLDFVPKAKKRFDVRNTAEKLDSLFKELRRTKGKALNGWVGSAS